MLLFKKNKKNSKTKDNKKEIINEIFKQKFGKDVPFVAEKINKYVTEMEKKELESFLKAKKEIKHAKRKEIERSLYSGDVNYQRIICSIS